MARKLRKRSQATTGRATGKVKAGKGKNLPTPVTSPKDDDEQSLDSSAEINQTSPFFTIPAELRNRIYDIVFEAGFLFGTIKPRHWFNYGLIEHPMTLVCRQIRSESLPIYLNRFTLGISNKGQVLSASNFLKALGPTYTSRLAIRITDPQILGHSILVCSTRRWREKMKAHELSRGEVLDIESPNDAENHITPKVFCYKILNEVVSMGIDLKWARLLPPDVSGESGSAVSDDGAPDPWDEYYPYRKRAVSKNELIALMALE